MSRLKLAVSVCGLLLLGVTSWKAASLQHVFLRLSIQSPELAMVQDGTTYRTVLVVGQSNAANHGSWRAHAPDPHRSWYAGQAYALRDPLPGCSGIGGSPWARLALLDSQKSKQNWLIACAAVGSSSMADWQPGGALFREASENLRQLNAFGLRPDWIVLHQGETDAFVGTDQKTYGRQLRRLVAELHVLAPQALIVLCQTSIHGRHVLPNPAVRAAQADVWRELPYVWAGVDTDSFPPHLRASDGVHFNDRGLQTFAALIRSAMLYPSDVARVYTP